MTEKKESLFGTGDKNEAYAAVFTGQSYLQMLADAPDGHFHIGNVTFEPGCRNNWHAHTDGYQILLVTDGQGIYQEFGKPARLIKAGDVVVTEQNVKHWHGAAADSWMSHVAITAGPSDFFEAVDDEAFAKANQEAREN